MDRSCNVNAILNEVSSPARKLTNQSVSCKYNAPARQMTCPYKMCKTTISNPCRRHVLSTATCPLSGYLPGERKDSFYEFLLEKRQGVCDISLGRQTRPATLLSCVDSGQLSREKSATLLGHPKMANHLASMRVHNGVLTHHCAALRTCIRRMCNPWS